MVPSLIQLKEAVSRYTCSADMEAEYLRSLGSFFELQDERTDLVITASKLAASGEISQEALDAVRDLERKLAADSSEAEVRRLAHKALQSL